MKISIAIVIDESDLYKCFEMQNIYEILYFNFVTLYLCSKKYNNKH